MIADNVRTSAYEQALRQSIRPGSTVLDIGTGIGFFAVLACHLGARKAIAVEPDDAIQVAREAAAAKTRPWEASPARWRNGFRAPSRRGGMP
jgi:protein arginine N-methyltransferase 1